MPPRNRAKLGLTIPVESRYRGFETSYGNNAPTLALSAAPSAALLSPSRRNVARSPRHHPSPRPQYLPRPIPAPPPVPARKMHQATAKLKLENEEAEELENLVHAKSNKRLTKQLSMSETPRDVAWEKRRRQVFRQERRRNSISVMATTPAPDTDPSQAATTDGEKLTDADLHELKGSIELGFGFNEEEGQKLCNTLPALDLYFAVNRQVSLSPMMSPRPTPATSAYNSSEDIWRICGPGDDPQEVKTKLRHWAQAVACSIMQSF
ncbi:hypothetical protein V2J09_008146 [Rumex salicifolius]